MGPPQNQQTKTIKLSDRIPEWLDKKRNVIVDFDLVYRKRKRYVAIPLSDFLYSEFDLENRHAKNAQLIFECSDGYQSPMSLAKALKTDGWIALEDTDAPKNQKWTPIGDKSPAPYYVVWRDLTRKEASGYPWPYAIQRIRLVQRDEFFEAAFPAHDKTAVSGYHAFRKHCFHCHSINGVGGKLGVELNSPRSVTEYWKPEVLRDYIVDPAVFRLRSKMPSMQHVPEEQIDAIVHYLHAISSFKASTSP